MTLYGSGRYNEHVIASLNLEKLDPVYRARASRLDKWRELSERARKELLLPEAPPERLMFLALQYVQSISHNLQMIFIDVLGLKALHFVVDPGYHIHIDALAVLGLAM